MNDEDMGHGFFVPVIALYIVWQYKDEIIALNFQPSKWGLALVAVSGSMLILATLGAELFVARLSFVLTLIGMVWTLGGRPLLRKVAFLCFSCSSWFPSRQ
jgi:exosortase